MNNKLRGLLIISLVVVVGLFLVGFMTHRGSYGMVGRRGVDCHGVGEFSSRYDENISEETQQELENLRAEYTTEIEDLSYELNSQRSQYQELYYSDNVSPDELRSSYQELTALERELSDLRFEYKLKQREILPQEELGYMHGRRSDDATRSRRGRGHHGHMGRY